MNNVLIKMIEWIENHYKLITGIVIPIIAAIFGKKLLNKKIEPTGNKNNVLTSDGNINSEHSFNPIEQNAGSNATQVIGNHNQIVLLAQSFNERMYPHAERAFKKINLNTKSFIAALDANLSHLTQSELDKFSEADVQIALQNAIRGAARTESNHIHEVLARLISDRVQKPRRAIAELAINESIEITSKLDVTLIKILALCFFFSRTKTPYLLDEDTLIKNMILISNEFKDIEVSQSKFEYLEALSCGKVMQFTQNDLVSIVKTKYPQLYLKEISLQNVDSLNLTDNINKACFIPSKEGFKLNPYIGLFLFENTPIHLNGTQFSLDDAEIKNRLMTLFTENQLSSEEIKIKLMQVPNLEQIIKLWNESGFSMFSLTAVGITIGRAYLELKNLGDYDINIWIN